MAWAKQAFSRLQKALVSLNSPAHAQNMSVPQHGGSNIWYQPSTAAGCTDKCAAAEMSRRWQKGSPGHSQQPLPWCSHWPCSGQAHLADRPGCPVALKLGQRRGESKPTYASPSACFFNCRAGTELSRLQRGKLNLAAPLGAAQTSLREGQRKQE